MSHEDCPGVPYECAGALARIEKALDGQLTPTRAAEIRLQFEECPPCLVAYEIQVKLHVTLSEQCGETAPADLRSRIGEALTSIDLTQIEITDL